MKKSLFNLIWGIALSVALVSFILVIKQSNSSEKPKEVPKVTLESRKKDKVEGTEDSVVKAEKLNNEENSEKIKEKSNEVIVDIK